MSCFNTLKAKGLRLTRPRRVILEYIHDSGGHLTAEDIISHVRIQYPHINKSTIYRTLELLEKNDCVFKSESLNHSVYHHIDEGHHHHLVCCVCGRTLDCDEALFSPVEKELEKKLGFQADFKHLVINGLCKDCLSKKT